MSGPAGILDLAGDGALGLVDGLGWVVALSGAGLAVLLVGTAIFAALIWTLKAVGWVARWATTRLADTVIDAVHRAAMHTPQAPRRPV